MKPHSAARSFIATIACVCIASVASAQAKLDFENLANPANSTGANLQGSSVTQNGFTVTQNGGGLFSVSPDSSLNYTGSVALFSFPAGTTTTLTQNDGNIFLLNSIDIANIPTQTASSGAMATVVFTGQLQNGGTVTQTFTHSNTNALETVMFSSDFSNLTSVSFTQDSTGSQFDNIILNSAPIPETSTVVSLVFLCVSGIGFVRRRRNLA